MSVFLKGYFLISFGKVSFDVSEKVNTCVIPLTFGVNFFKRAGPP